MTAEPVNKRLMLFTVPPGEGHSTWDLDLEFGAAATGWAWCRNK